MIIIRKGGFEKELDTIEDAASYIGSPPVLVKRAISTGNMCFGYYVADTENDHYKGEIYKGYKITRYLARKDVFVVGDSRVCFGSINSAKIAIDNYLRVQTEKRPKF